MQDKDFDYELTPEQLYITGADARVPEMDGYYITYTDGVTAVTPMGGAGPITIKNREEAEIFTRAIMDNYSMKT